MKGSPCSGSHQKYCHSDCTSHLFNNIIICISPPRSIYRLTFKLWPDVCFLFLQKCSRYPKILTATQFKPPCFNCPCQLPYIGGNALVEEPSQRGHPQINSATNVVYAPIPWNAHAWPGVLRGGSKINFQVENFRRFQFSLTRIYI